MSDAKSSVCIVLLSNHWGVDSLLWYGAAARGIVGAAKRYDKAYAGSLQSRQHCTVQACKGLASKDLP